MSTFNLSSFFRDETLEVTLQRGPKYYHLPHKCMAWVLPNDVLDTYAVSFAGLSEAPPWVIVRASASPNRVVGLGPTKTLALEFAVDGKRSRKLRYFVGCRIPNCFAEILAGPHPVGWQTVFLAFSKASPVPRLTKGGRPSSDLTDEQLLRLVEKLRSRVSSVEQLAGRLREQLKRRVEQ